MLGFLLLLAPCCLFAAPHSEKAALARLNEDVNALEMSLEQKKKKKEGFDWDPIGNMPRDQQDKYFSGSPNSREWDVLRQFAAAVYEPKGHGRHIGEDIKSNAYAGQTHQYEARAVPWTVFKVPLRTFSFVPDVTCVVAFRGTNPKEGVGKGADLYTDYTEIVHGSKSRSGGGGLLTKKTERIKTAVTELFTVDPPSHNGQNWQSECKGGIIATGHSLGGCAALNAAVYGGVRAFTFAGPGPATGGGFKVHHLAQMATLASATLYAGGDVIPFAAQHIGDRMCRLKYADEPKMKEAEEYNEMQSGTKEFSKNINLWTAGHGLAGHTSVLANAIPNDSSCFSQGFMSGGFRPVGRMSHSPQEWAQHHFGHNGELSIDAEALSIDMGAYGLFGGGGGGGRHGGGGGGDRYGGGGRHDDDYGYGGGGGGDRYGGGGGGDRYGGGGRHDDDDGYDDGYGYGGGGGGDPYGGGGGGDPYGGGGGGNPYGGGW